MRNLIVLSLIIVVVMGVSGQSKRKRPAPKKSDPKFESPCGVRQTIEEFIDEISVPWRLAGETNRATFYYSTNKIVCTKDGILKVWIKSIPKTIEGSTAYSLMRYEFKCRSDELRIVGATDYDKDGKVVNLEDYDNPRWSEAVPESVGESILDTVCHNP